MTKKTYIREFKLKVVHAVEAAELRPAQACREYQMTRFAGRLRALQRVPMWRLDNRSTRR